MLRQVPSAIVSFRLPGTVTRPGLLGCLNCRCEPILEAAIAWARSKGAHKISLDVFPHNTAAIALYEKFGFVREGDHPKHLRRKTGEIWDVISMGLVL